MCATKWRQWRRISRVYMVRFDSNLRLLKWSSDGYTHLNRSNRCYFMFLIGILPKITKNPNPYLVKKSWKFSLENWNQMSQFGDGVSQFGDIYLGAITYFLMMYFHWIKLFGHRKDSIEVILGFKVPSVCDKVAPMKTNFTYLYGMLWF